MRTTITFENDVAAALERLRRERDAGISEVVNQLIRSGLTVRDDPEPYRLRPRSIGLQVDVSNVEEALDLMEGSERR